MDDPRLTELQEMLQQETDGRLGWRHLYVHREEYPLLSPALHDTLFRLSHADVQVNADGARIYRVPLVRYTALVEAVNRDVLAARLRGRG